MTDTRAIFEVAIGPDLDEGTYRVTVVRSPAGETSVVTKLDLKALGSQLDKLVTPIIRPAHERIVREIGTRLFTALLAPVRVLALYRASIAIAASSDQELQIILRIEVPRLRDLPWEAMYDDRAKQYICRTQSLVRVTGRAKAVRLARRNSPLRVLVFGDRARLLTSLVGTLDDLVRAKDVHLTSISNLTTTDFPRHLPAGPWDVLHFHDYQFPYQFPLAAVEEVISDPRQSIELLVLDSEFPGNGGLHLDLPALVYMQHNITEPARTAYNRAFYETLAKSRDPVEAVASGRAAILLTTSNTAEWAAPVLYLSQSSAGAELADPALKVPSRPIHVLETTRAYPAYGLAFSPDGEWIASSDGDEVQLWNPVRHERHRPIACLGQRIFGIAFSPDGSCIATGHADGRARLWRASDGEPLRTFECAKGDESGMVFALAFNSSGSKIAMTFKDAALAFEIDDKGIQVTQFWHTDATAWAVAFHDSMAVGGGTAIYSGSPDKGAVHEWQMQVPVRALAFSPDGTRLAFGGDQNTTAVLNTSDYSQVWRQTGGNHEVLAVAFSPDGKLLATGSSDKTVSLYQAADGVLLGTLEGHFAAVYGLAFSPDGGRLASADAIGTIRVWE
jgi:WD40 repeat protein